MVQLSFSYVAGYLLLLIVNTKSLKYRSLVNVKSTPVFEPLKELYEVKVHGSDNSKWQPALLFIPLVIFGSTAANAEVGTSIADPIQDHGADYYAKYFLAGALSASFSHGVTVSTPYEVLL